MAFVGTNATGWSELYTDLNVVGAVYVMYDTAFLNWSIVLLFLLYQFMLYLKTKNLTISFVTGAFFVSMFGAANLGFVKPMSLNILYVLLALEAAGIVFLLFFKK